MKHLMKKVNLIVGMMVVVMVGCIFVACSNDDHNLNLQLLEEQSRQKTILNKETADFKSGLISAVNLQKTKASAEEFRFSAEQVKDLRKQSLKMFKSHGFVEDEFKEFMDEGDERLILIATMFTAIMESPVATFSRIKTRSEGGSESGECFSWSKALACGTSVLYGIIPLNDIRAAFAGAGCLTKTVALNILKSLVKKATVWVAIGAIIIDYSLCMDWI